MDSVPGQSDHQPVNPESDAAIERWEPSGVVTAMWVSLSLLLGALALFLFGLLFVMIGRQPEGEMLVFERRAVVVLTAATLVVHQLLHAGVSRLFGGQPRLQLDVLQWIIPVIYCRVTGQFFSRIQFLTFSLAPLVLLSVVGVAFMPLSERAALFIIPLAVNASFSIRDVWTTWIVWRMPPGSMIQAEQNGLLLIREVER